MKTSDFEDKYAAIINNWNPKKDTHFTKLLTFLKTSNPRSPLVRFRLDEDWNNYKELYDSLLNEIETELPSSSLDQGQLDCLVQLKKNLKVIVLQERRYFKEMLFKRAHETKDELPMPSLLEQITYGEIFPDSPVYQKIYW